MRRLNALPAFVAIVTLAACSGTASTPASSSPTSAPAAGSPAAGSPAAESGGTGGGAACATAPAGSTAAVNVTIMDFKFAPQPVQAKVGDVIAWTNQDGSTPHSATLDDGTCDTKPIAGGASASLVFTAPGTYTYHCSVHPTQMKGYSIVVT